MKSRKISLWGGKYIHGGRDSTWSQGDIIPGGMMNNMEKEYGWMENTAGRKREHSSGGVRETKARHTWRSLCEHTHVDSARKASR